MQIGVFGTSYMPKRESIITLSQEKLYHQGKIRFINFLPLDGTEPNIRKEVRGKVSENSGKYIKKRKVLKNVYYYNFFFFH